MGFSIQEIQPQVSSLVIYNALIVPDGHTAPFHGWLATEDDKIAAVGAGEVPPQHLECASRTVDAGGAMLLPGAIDCHVHFREPGLTHKATIASESRAAIVGGVTSYIDMPNCVPPTVTLEAWHDKMERAAATSRANYAFMIGATAANLPQLLNADPRRMPAVKVFMGSSTGNMLIDDDSSLRKIFAEQPFRVVVHAEDQAIINRNTAAAQPLENPSDMMWHTRLRNDEACVRATERAMQLAVRYGTRLHVAHVTTALETRLFDPSPSPAGKQITAEVSPHHLIHSSDDYPRLGARIKMNPAVKSPADRLALRDALAEGRLDIVATDHAPHLLSEKQGDVFHAVSGAPMVQFSLPAMLDMFPPSTVVARMCEGPAVLFGIEGRGSLRPGNYADMALVEKLAEPHIVDDADVVSLCGWTPMAGSPIGHRVVETWVNGGSGPMPLAFKN